MTPLYSISIPAPGKLAIAARPRGGDWLGDEMAAWRRAGVDVVVSLLTPDEAADLDLTNECRDCEANGIEFIAFPIPDRGVPASREAFADLTAKLHARLMQGQRVAAHCRQGLGRAPLAAIGVLMNAGKKLDEAIELTGAARGCKVPETEEQRKWLALTAIRAVVEPTDDANRSLQSH